MSRNIQGSLDANVVLRWLLGDIESQKNIADKLISSGKNLRVSMLVLAEIVFILEGNGFTRQEIRENILVLSSQPNLILHRSIITPALELYVKRPALSFIDACLVFEAKVESATPLFTFDKKLVNRSDKNAQIPH